MNMKFFVIFALALATVSAFDLRNAELKQRNIVVPVMETEGRITNGYIANVGQFPYQVGLLPKKGFLTYGWCGGSIISPEYLLTAAHCLDDAESVTAFLGATERNSPEKTVTVPSTAFIIHDGWNRQAKKNDIALIRIPHIIYTNKTQAVQLPAISSSYPSYEEEVVVASGWGSPYDDSDITDDLQWAYMRVTSNDECAKTYGATVTPSILCVSTHNGTSPCHGDSGGPLVCGSSTVQIGLASFVPTAGCTVQLPAAYTRVSSYLTWIRHHTGIV